MAYEVTATRKRPQLFDNLVGQQFVVSTIKHAIEQGRTAHAYLFSGPRGVGKTSSARILAKALNCVEGPTPYPCGVCPNCREITAGNSTDVIEIDGASNTSVNDIRVIKDEVLFPPASCRYKIYIIDEVHMLSTSAFNALLKTIEEPPEYVVFIFATTETQKVPATIRSRCQQFHFQLIPLETIKEVLARTAMEMGIAAEDEALFWIAKESTGSMRDAYTLFDQVVSFSHGNITMDRIEEQLGLAGMDKLSAIVEVLGAGEGQAAIGALHSLLDAGVSVEQAIKDLANYMRTLLLAKRGVTSESTLGMRLNQIPPGILDVFAEEQLEAALELFFSLYRDIRFSLNPRFELELAISRLLNLRYMASSVTLVNKIEALKAQLLDPASVAQVVVKPAPQIVEARPTESKTIAQKVSKTIKDEPLPPKETIIVKENPPSPAVQSRQITKELLPELIQQLAAERDPVGIVLSQVVEVSHDDQALRFVFASKYAMDTAKQNEERLRTLVSRHTGYDGPMFFERLEQKKEAQAPAEKRTTDELAHTIATLFRGEVLAPSRPEEK